MIKGQTAHLQRDGIRSAAHADTVTHLVKRNQDPHQELLVFRFQWQGEPINNRSEDLKKLSYSVKVFGLINKPEVEKEMRISPNNGYHMVIHKIKIIQKTTQESKT